jgi:hypothetical protein
VSTPRVNDSKSVEVRMIGTNQDLIEMQQILDREILRLNDLSGGTSGPGGTEQRLALMCRQISSYVLQ